MAKIPCTYCNTLNDPAAKTCVGCGAPLESPPAPQSLPKPFQAPPVPAASTPSAFNAPDSQRLQAGAQQVERVYAGAMNVYHAAWSVTSDAIAIAAVAFILGVVGGATDMRLWGVLGAMLVGLFVGYTEQSFWVNIIAAPAGALIGIVGWAFVWLAGGGPKGMVFAATGLACLGALVAARRRTTSMGCVSVVRPVLGAVGGFFFALLGLVIGLALHAIIK